MGEAEHGTAGREAPLSVGEAKWNATMGLAHPERLRRIRSLPASRNTGACEQTRLLCFGVVGFTDDLRAVADRDPAVQLVGPNRLHEGEGQRRTRPAMPHPLGRGSQLCGL
ncbi:hypothetical protein [Streptomyces sp. NPDC058632]|uniref:hypothetical protein n=1 Tax=Streptomyces sp. NPDC058632 TaxID=3346567 RepID=UPI003659DC29